MSQPLMQSDMVAPDDEQDPALDATTADAAAPEPTDDAPAAAAAPGDTDATGQPTTPEPAGTVPTAPPVSSDPAPAPLTVAAHGKRATIEGAQFVGNRIEFANDTAKQRVQSLLSRGLEMETYGRTRIRELELHTQELQQSQSDAEVQANAIIEWFEQVAQSEESMAQALVHFATEKPKLDARIERAKWEAEKRQWDRRQRAGEPTPQERQAQLLESARDLGQQVLTELTPQLGLQDPEVKAIAARLLRKPEVYLAQIPTPNGPQLAFDDEAFAADVREEAQLRTQSRTVATAAQQAADANAKQKAGTIPAVVRAPAAPVTPTPPRDTSTGRFKSKEEWEAAMNLR